MHTKRLANKMDFWVLIPVIVLTMVSVFVLRSITPSLFPLYLVYILGGFTTFFVFSRIEFDVISVFYKFLYLGSIGLLILPLFIGQITRGAIRWIPLGNLSIQPAELVRPFLLIFFAKFLCVRELKITRLVQALILIFIPSFLIIIQPSLGVTFLTLVSFFGVLIASNINKKMLLAGSLLVLIIIPVFYHFIAPYQQTRIKTFLSPVSDPMGAGYNSIQSVISVGAGGILGRGLGKGIQTQLAFLPEKHTDFIFASTAEELGFLGGILILTGLFIILYRLTILINRAASYPARGYLAGVFVVLLVQVVVNVAMNLGIFPVAGLPLPIVSAGGSSYLSTMIMLGLAVGAVKHNYTS